jgi:hypothetical protein
LKSLNLIIVLTFTISALFFGVSDTGKPATLSFLAPSYNENREINDTRLKIHLIAGVNEILQEYLPNQMGRFDDSFNLNCIGDTFQYLGVPTILIEAGHFLTIMNVKKRENMFS